MLGKCPRCKQGVETGVSTAGGRPQTYLRKHKAPCGLDCLPKSQGKLWEIEVHYSMKGCRRCGKK